MLKNNMECPVDFVLINERKARLVAGIVLLFTLVYLFTCTWIIPAFLALDFFTRGFNFGKYSILNLAGDRMIHIFNIKSKLTDQAPKRFAAKIGFLFSACIVILLAFRFDTAALITAGVLALFAFLESVFAFCAGCHVYNFYSKVIK